MFACLDNDCTHDGSDGYSMSDIIYQWQDEKKGVGMEDSLKLPQFEIVGHKQHSKVINLSTGESRQVMLHALHEQQCSQRQDELYERFVCGPCL